MTPADHKMQINRYLSEGVIYYRGEICNLRPIEPEDPKNRIQFVNSRIVKQAAKAIQKENK